MRTIEGSLPKGPDFHKALLDAAALTVEGIRERLDPRDIQPPADGRRCEEPQEEVTLGKR